MPADLRKVSVPHLFVGIAAVFLLAFDMAAALAHRAELTRLALALTGLISAFVILVGIWSGLKAIRKSP